MLNKEYNLNPSDLRIVEERANYNLMTDPTVSVYAVLDGVPNYYIINKHYNKIEAYANSLVIAKKYLEAAEDALVNGLDETMVGHAGLLNS